MILPPRPVTARGRGLRRLDDRVRRIVPRSPASRPIIHSHARVPARAGRQAVMQAIWDERKGAAGEGLRHGELAAPQPGPGQVRVQVMASAVSPDDVWARGGAPGEEAMRYPFVVPHQDGAGWIDEVGYGVPRGRIGERVWLFMAQWQSPW